MQEFHTDFILSTTEFSSFYKSAVDFCDFIETTKTNKEAFVKCLTVHLGELYKTAFVLPWVKLESNVDYDANLDSEVFNKILVELAIKLRDHRYYWHVFDPTNNEDKSPVCGDLVDDIGDILVSLSIQFKFSISINPTAKRMLYGNSNLVSINIGATIVLTH